MAVPELAQELSVEPSLVYKWRRNERTPQLHTAYVSQIAEVLGASAAERAALEASQVHSLRAPRAPLHGATRRMPRCTACSVTRLAPTCRLLHRTFQRRMMTRWPTR